MQRSQPEQLCLHLQLAYKTRIARCRNSNVDKVVVCRECGERRSIWPAERQKWWYEVAKGNINTEAVLVRACRHAEKDRKTEARRVHLEGIARKHERTET